ncbi:conserved hypothetical protein [Talaromyces stipitatus ATCC 10500]|uniref:Histidine acid phosphatase n=1 Tax=Talaromyces stipitatus (strain ATCC 10500 / CBS 375.48 / QM 6759 / NRRL 1006) TaxID=441959 RepID=B8M7S0_TALSN|nr:uncharacterized protein TSTA_030650 [Talaromyces stipitatus ATCC 10500]EED19799.1 conserved hypothetical protein [Talaromyces stipitatus ATCC 10500]
MQVINFQSIVLAVLAAMHLQVASSETVLGAYIYQRHGDRTPKIIGSPSLTALGYEEVFARGSYYNKRYIVSNSSYQIDGIATDLVKLSQLNITAPWDNVIQNSGAGWLQGLYPPAGQAASQTLSNGTSVEPPLNGFQLIPIGTTSSGSGSESAPWLQSVTGCKNAQVSSNNYFSSDSYQALLLSTKSLYQSLLPMVKATFSLSDLSFKNAFSIWDVLNVASIHNSTKEYPALQQLNSSLMNELFGLASIHEYNLAYNASDPVRAIAGAVLAGQVLQGLNNTITSSGRGNKLTIQFGSYATALSYFGLAQLPAANSNFTGIPSYASSMIWELVTNSSLENGFPSTSDIYVRFYFHNGTSAASPDLESYPLFNQPSLLLSWSDFVSSSQAFAITSEAQWCQQCGNSGSICSAADSTASNASVSATPSSAGGISKAVAGVIGAMVTLGVILGVEALIMLVGGISLTRKRATPVENFPAAEKVASPAKQLKDLGS